LSSQHSEDIVDGGIGNKKPYEGWLPVETANASSDRSY
jgi:hypothetical protein